MGLFSALFGNAGVIHQEELSRKYGKLLIEDKELKRGFKLIQGAIIMSIIFLGIFIIPQKTEAQYKSAIVIKTHCFSNPNTLDTFKLSYNLGNLRDTVLFEIVSSKGNRIYKMKFPGWALFDYRKPSYMYYTEKGWNARNYFKNKNDSVAKTDSLIKEDHLYLQSKISGFFDEKNFFVNPIPDMLKRTKDYLVVGAYETLLNEPDMIGFFYHLSEGDGRMIAYSRKKNKVFLFWNC